MQRDNPDYKSTPLGMVVLAGMKPSAAAAVLTLLRLRVPGVRTGAAPDHTL